MMTNPASLDELKRQLEELETLSRQGVLTGDAARAAREDLERRIVAAVTTQATAPAPVAEAAPRLPTRLKVIVAAFVLVAGGAGYALHGDWQGWKVGPPDPALREQAAAGAGAEADGPDAKQIEAMVAALEERLKGTPDDVQAWQMLGRTYAALGRADDALKAFRKVSALKPGDAQALADLADALGMANNRSLEGEPERLIAQALKADPKNVKALALGGTIAFNREQYPQAAALWERAIQAAGPQGEFAKQLQGAVDEARRRGGMAPVAAASAAAPAAAGKTAAAAGATSVSGRVELAPALRERIAPGDTVFVFARPAEGPRMPLATLRKTAADLPFSFTLDDSQAMSPDAKLSSQQRVVIGVRISKSGDALPRPGDLQGFSQPVAVGARDVRVLIDDTVR